MNVHVDNNSLCLGDVRIDFQRTLRIPDDGTRYPLPPGLGQFPLRRVEDYAGRVPTEWKRHGGVFLPMYQREAMWLRFSGARQALKIGVGKVCAISGERWAEGLRKTPQNYVVTGAQPWLDGIANGKGTIRQFVAMPLGLGYTVEGQVTGEEKHGGIQLQCYAPKPGAIPHPPRTTWTGSLGGSLGGSVGASVASLGASPGSAPPQCAAPCSAPSPRARRSGAMGIAGGGTMVQKIYPDPHGIDAWDQASWQRVFVHIVNSELWREITGEEPPASPVTAKSYARAGLPWFSLYDEGAATIDPSHSLAQVKSVKEIDDDKSTQPLQDDDSVEVGAAKKIAHAFGKLLGVNDGDW